MKKPVLLIVFICFAMVPTWATDSSSKANHIIKLSMFPDFGTLRLQYERSLKNHFSYGGMTFFSPNGEFSNHKASQWFGIAPFARIYSHKKSRGVYLQLHIPINYYYNRIIDYKSVQSYYTSGGWFREAGYYNKHESIRQSYLTSGGGGSMGFQFSFLKRIFMDITVTHEQYFKPSNVKEKLWFPKDDTNFEEFELDEYWMYTYGNIYLGYKLFK